VKIDNELKTQKEILELLKQDGKIVKPNYFSKLVSQGKIPFHKKENSKKKYYYYYEIKPFFIQEKNDKEIKIPKELNNQENNQELQEILSQATTPVQKVQILKDFWASKINQHKYEVEKGKYYLKEEINKKAEYVISSAKSKFLALPSKIAPALVGIDDIAVIKNILEDAIYEILNELGGLNELV